MWALRRLSSPLKGLSVVVSRACYATSEVLSQGMTEIPELCEVVTAGQQMHYRVDVSSNCLFGRRAFSSQASKDDDKTESGDDSEDGFSDLEAPACAAIEPDLADDDTVEEPSHNGLEDLSDNEEEEEGEEEESGEKLASRKREPSKLFRAILANSGLSIHEILDKWVDEGKDLGRSDISSAVLQLRKRRMYGRALQISDWLEEKKHIEFTEREYASRVDLIGKVRGIQKAESYIAKIPQSCRGEVVYRTFLANCVCVNNQKKSEEVFNKMKDLKFPVTSFACNQLLLLYKRGDKKKIADVLLLMEKENVKPSRFTYKLLIDTKGQSNDISGMDQVVETMKGEGIDPDLHTQSIMAKHYVSGGLKEKAEAILKEMEGGNLKEHRWACRSLLPLYGALGKADEVGRVWKVCESNPNPEECMGAIEAWGRLKKVDKAEEVFERMEKTCKKLSSRQYSAILKVYANNKMLTKGREVVKRMGENGCRIGPLTWDALVKLYVEAGEVEKADTILQKAAHQNTMKPLFNTYMAILNQYAKRGDIHNTEKMFHRMRLAGYVARINQFSALVQAYVNAKAPAYGMRDRLRADNIFPNKGLAAELAKIDAFRKTPVSDLLD